MIISLHFAPKSSVIVSLHESERVWSRAYTCWRASSLISLHLKLATISFVSGKFSSLSERMTPQIFSMKAERPSIGTLESLWSRKRLLSTPGRSLPCSSLHFYLNCSPCHFLWGIKQKSTAKKSSAFESLNSYGL